MPLIKCSDVSLAYENNIVLSNVNFSVAQGDYLCIVGENGSGKSTLIKALLGLKKPIHGAIEYADGLMQNEIGYLPQQTGIQKDFPASVYEVVLSGCINRLGNHAFFTKKERLTAEKNMDILGISDISKSCYRELSGGQQQRVLLARALCATGKLLLLDEPVSGLDPVVTKEMYGIIKKLNQENAITVIMISHDIACAVNNADKILHLKQKQLFYGTSVQYRHSEIGRSFLGGGNHAEHH